MLAFRIAKPDSAVCCLDWPTDPTPAAQARRTPGPPPETQAGSQSCAYTSSPLRTTIIPNLLYCHYIVSDRPDPDTANGPCERNPFCIRGADHDGDCENAFQNARRLATDVELYGTTFTDITGRRIDPTTIRPSNGGGFLGDPDMSLGETRDATAELLAWIGSPDGRRPTWAEIEVTTFPPECEYCLAEDPCGCTAAGVVCRCCCGRCMYPGRLPDDGPARGDVLRADDILPPDSALTPLQKLTLNNVAGKPPFDDQRSQREDRA